MKPVETIVAAHLDAWNARAGPDRAHLIASVCAPDVLIGEPQRALRGHDGMEEAIASLQALGRHRTRRPDPRRGRGVSLHVVIDAS